MGLQQRSGPSGPKGGQKATMTKAGGTVGTAAVANVTVTVTGAQITDLAIVSTLAALPAGLALGSPAVLAADTVTIPVINPTAAPVAAGTLSLAVELRKYST